MTASAFARKQVLQIAAGLDQKLQEELHAASLHVDGCLTVSKREAAALLGVSLRTFDRLVQARLLRTVRGLRGRYSRKAIEQYVDCHVHSVKARVA
jgi:excisionase family DNA binding protein